MSYKKKIIIRENYGWNLYERKGIKLWFSGYLLEGRDCYDLLEDVIGFDDKNEINIQRLSSWTRGISGNFSFIIEAPDLWHFAAVDKVCSIPLYEKDSGAEYTITNHAAYLGTDDFSLDLKALLEVSMSGYTLGRKTIYKDIKRFSSGECSLWIDDVLHRDYYYIYLPFETVKSETQLKQDFLNVSLHALRRTISSVRGRQIVVPLSAGYDSRLIVSGLRELGYENVVCFSYGRKGNYEVRTSKEVARKLDYKWVHVPIKLRSKRSFFLSKVYRDYVDRFESYSSVPNVQEVYEIYKLSLLNIIDKDAVIINGNTGDFISGGHIPLDASKFKKKFSSDEFNWSSFLNKHYSIWRSLRSSFNDKIIISELNKITKSICKSETEVSNYAVMECMEFIGRQSRFVMNQQRSYDFINHDWRLPLWDSEFLNFWESVPLEYKKGQKLYKESLLEANWGGVWVDIPVNNKLIRPFSLMILRLIFKILISPFGKKVWHNLEKNIFVYWMHPSYARSVESYKNVLFDIRGQRNTNSWQADHFVKKYGFQSVTDVSSAVKNKIKI